MRLKAFATALALVWAFPAAAETYATPKALLEALYAGYASDDPEATPDSELFFSDRLKHFFEEDRRQSDGIGAIDFDPVVVGQDYQVSGVTVGAVDEKDGKAVAEVRFRNFDTPVTLTYSLVDEHGGWKVDDIESKAKDNPFVLTKIFEDYDY